MASVEFRCVVLGDEPAGLWLLRELAGSLENAKPGRLGWISFSPPSFSTCVPTSVAADFGLSVGDPWSAEVLSPRESFYWDDESLAKRFPRLPLGAAAKGPGALTAVRSVLAKQPELLGYAGGLWNYVGRSAGLHPESMILGTLGVTSLSWWRPQDEVPASVDVLHPGTSRLVLEKFQPLRDGTISIKFQGQEPVLTRSCILNLPWRHLRRLAGQSPELANYLAVTGELRSGSALYSLNLKMEGRGIPAPVRPLSVYLDTTNIPDPETETWPFVVPARETGEAEAMRTLQLWVSGPREVALEAVLERFRDGFPRLRRLFPFLDDSLQELSVPLDAETCLSESARSAMLDTLETTSIERFALTSFGTGTRHPSISMLTPFLNCHLPHPLGPLMAAKKLLSELVPTKHKKSGENKAHDVSAQ